jgi:glutamate 5-kinase
MARLVIKIGSSLLTNDGRGLDRLAIGEWVRQMVALKAAGHQIVLVSSGAIAEGIQRLGWAKRPSAVNELQAAAAVGQMGLVQVYETAFSARGCQTAQILLTHEDLADRRRYLNAKSTLTTLIALGVVPIINENDTVVTDEIKLGDNDTLGALVTNLIDGDQLIILTDQRGLYTADPRRDPQATLVQKGNAGDPALAAMAGGAGSNIGKGGMLTKIKAAERAARSGATTVIVSGREADVLTRVLGGELLGTTLTAAATPVAARKQWLYDHLQMGGAVVVDAGAVRALRESGKSLLPIGVADVRGEFERGAVISVLDEGGREVARGLTNYAAIEALRIVRKPTAEIEATLGYMHEVELIHRDNLVLV